eukprot:4018740-Pyramimonas_sp.AAC.1
MWAPPIKSRGGRPVARSHRRTRRVPRPISAVRPAERCDPTAGGASRVRRIRLPGADPGPATISLGAIRRLRIAPWRADR